MLHVLCRPKENLVDLPTPPVLDPLPQSQSDIHFPVCTNETLN
jgi:hypothetical protein